MNLKIYLLLLATFIQANVFALTKNPPLRNALTDMSLTRIDFPERAASITLLSPHAASNKEVIMHITWRKYNPEKVRQGAGLFIAGSIVLAGATAMMITGYNQSQHWSEDRNETTFLSLGGVGLGLVGLSLAIPGFVIMRTHR